MKFRLLVLLLVLPFSLAAATTLKVDRPRSFVDVDVKATVGSFTGRLETYEAQVTFAPSDKIQAAVFSFKFADLKTGEAKRDAEMIKWLGGGDPAGSFQLGALALTPDGHGHATGRLTIKGRAELIEFPVTVSQLDGEWTIAGTATLHYTDWGLKVIRKMGLLRVDPEVKVRFKLIGTPVEAK
ncbi:MAG TPA: YceI family protein [Opitutaceae bacterium]|nr:YceI family protein [Opitutaceae bacterium]